MGCSLSLSNCLQTMVCIGKWKCHNLEINFPNMWIVMFLAVFSIGSTDPKKLHPGNSPPEIVNNTLQPQRLPVHQIHIDLSNLQMEKIDSNAFDNSTEARCLDLSKNHLSQLPPSIFSKLIQLETLSLAENRLWSLQAETFLGLDRLRSLNMSNNQLKHLQTGVFYGLTQHVVVIVEGNHLTSISTDIFNKPILQKEQRTALMDSLTPSIKNKTLSVRICKTLDGMVTSLAPVTHPEIDRQNETCTEIDADMPVRINLDGLGLRTFRKGWYQLSRFHFLNLSLKHNNITDIEAEMLNDLPEVLERIDLSFNQIEVIRKNRISNPNLYALYFNSNRIVKIEEGALEKTSMNDFAMSNNCLTSLGFISELPGRIFRFDVSNNSISKLPDDVLRPLKHVAILVLSNNYLTELPADTFVGLRRLFNLDLSFNRLTKLHPGTFQDQGEMFHLNLSHNLLTSIEHGVFKGADDIHTIILDNNRIKRISNNTFAELEKNWFEFSITLADNEIDVVEVGSFARIPLRRLNLRNNRIARIPRGAFDTPSLIDLNLADNFLRNINGQSFAGLPNLRLLDVSRNHIEKLNGDAWSELSELDRLDLSGNPIDRFENGGLYGLGTRRSVNVTVVGVPLKVIEGGVFLEQAPEFAHSGAQVLRQLARFLVYAVLVNLVAVWMR